MFILGDQTPAPVDTWVPAGFAAVPMEPAIAGTAQLVLNHEEKVFFALCMGSQRRTAREPSPPPVTFVVVLMLTPTVSGRPVCICTNPDSIHPSRIWRVAKLFQRWLPLGMAHW